MANSRPNQKGRSPGAPDKQSPVRLRPTSGAFQLPEGPPHGSCEDREGPPFSVESDLSGDMAVGDQELDGMRRRPGGAFAALLAGPGREEGGGGGWGCREHHGAPATYSFQLNRGASMAFRAASQPDPIAPRRGAALYLRVSTGRQAVGDVSIPSQRELTRRFCEARGWAVTEEFVESGASAIDDR